jgi:hypothetical protein
MARCAFTRLVHSDWSTAPSKRCCAEAQRTSSGWFVDPPKRTGVLTDFLDDLLGLPQPTLAGFDFPIGVPTAYARKAEISSFPELLEVLGAGVWSDFYRVCEDSKEISLHRPFYPRVSSSKARQVHLRDALGFGVIDALRICERQTKTRKAACSLFWTLGGNQVGKAAISGWRDVVQPARKAGALLWPFDGELTALSESGSLVICETYPAEAYRHVGVQFPAGASKRNQTSRREAMSSVFEWARCWGVSFSERMRDAIDDGFGAHKSGEDPFDAAIGLLGMIEVVDGRRSAAPTPIEAGVSEGWILGQAAESYEAICAALAR